MTPEQLQHYVDAALKQRDQFSFVFYPLVVVLSLGGAWLLSYLREKGKNLATKEDVSTLTHTVESIKSALATKQHFNQIRYERELKVYEDLWPKLCALETAALGLRPVFEFGLAERETEEIRRQNRAQRFWDAHGSFMNAVNHSRPFHSPEVWEQLQKLVKLCWGEAVEWGLFSNELLRRARENRENYWDKAIQNADAINAQIAVISESIRTRLSHFD